MKHTTHALIQGDSAWHSHRDDSYNASELLLAAGCTIGRKTRAGLIRKMATGLSEEEITPFLQKLFDDGHRFERLAMPYAEGIIGEELFPTTVSVTVPGLRKKLSSSLDGATDDDSVNYEHKTLNKEISEALDLGFIPDYLHWQMEQGQLINGATRTLFVASTWDDNDQLIDIKHCWYESNPELRAKIIPTWQQAEKDADAYVHVEVIPAAVAAPTLALPSLTVQVNGSITITDNLALFGEKLKSFIGGLDTKPTDDQGFADIEAAVKVLQKAQDALETAEASALAQVASVDELRSTVKLYADLARDTRLMLDKLVKARKKQIKIEIQGQANDAIVQHIDDLNKRLGKPCMPSRVWANFGGCMKGLKTVASIRNAVATEMAKAKIDSNEVADKIHLNLETLRALASDCAFLFADTSTIVMKENDDLIALIKSRISDHKAAEAAKLEAERERIRAEEEAKAEAKVRAEQERAALANAMLRTAAIDEEDAKENVVQPQEAAVVSSQKERHASPGKVTTEKFDGDHPSPPCVDAQQCRDGRPTGAQIIEVVALAFGVSDSTAADWLVKLIKLGTNVYGWKND